MKKEKLTKTLVVRITESQLKKLTKNLIKEGTKLKRVNKSDLIRSLLNENTI